VLRNEDEKFVICIRSPDAPCFDSLQKRLIGYFFSRFYLNKYEQPALPKIHYAGKTTTIFIGFDLMRT